MTGRRKRPPVPEESRKRVARACGACRKVKEKCEGGFPCARCTRLNRDCQTFEVSRIIETTARHIGSRDDDDEFYDKERIEALEKIVEHSQGCVDFGKANLVRIVQSLRQRNKPRNEESRLVNETLPDSETDKSEPIASPIRSSTTAYPDGLSHHEFSDYVQSKLKESLSGTEQRQEAHVVTEGVEINRAHRLRTQQSIVANAVASLPPSEVTNFLIETFFKYAQTNYYYIDEQFLRKRLEYLYSEIRNFGTEDAPWICTLLMVLAMGTQFAHFHSPRVEDASVNADDAISGSDLSLEDEAALTFYHAATTLIPDTVSIASIESVQAFLLLGVYTLPIDAAGMSFIFLGIAVKIAIQNGMHRRSTKHIDGRTIEMRNRIWFTAYTLEKRVCVLHGRPVSISRSEVDTALPSDFQPFRPKDRIDTLPNVLAMIKLTSLLEDARNSISLLRKAEKTAKTAAIESLSHIRQSLYDYWQSMPTKTYCRDFTPDQPLFRSNVHLALTYHLANVFIGRNFIFALHQSSEDSAVEAGNNARWQELRVFLVSSCIKSAIEIIDLCQMLHDETGLARASYTEFTTCRAALLAIMAQRIYKRDTHLRNSSEQGIALLKRMSLGFYSADAEKLQIEAMETAIRRLDDAAHKRKPVKAAAPDSDATAYDQFRSWAMLWKNKSTTVSNSSSSTPHVADTGTEMRFDMSTFPTLSPLQDLGWDVYLPSPFELDNDFTFDTDNI